MNLNHEGMQLTSLIQKDFETFVKSLLTHISVSIQESVSMATQISKEEKRNIECQQTAEINKDFITRNEALNFLKISSPTLHRYQKEGLLPYYKVGRKVFFKLSELVVATKVDTGVTVKAKKGGYNDR